MPRSNACGCCVVTVTINPMTQPTHATDTFRAARDLLLRHREDYAAAVREFSWPELTEFNWALDWFDVIAAEHPGQEALRVVAEDGVTTLTYGDMAARSSQAANWLRGLGARRGDRLLLMLGNIAPLWEVILAAIKLGVVIIPASTLLSPDDLADRIDRGNVRFVVTETAQRDKFQGLPGFGAGGWTPILVEPGAGGEAGPWHRYAEAFGAPAEFAADGPTAASDPLLLYFTSGTTAQPKLVEHTHVSYPVGHLSTAYWIGLQPGDVHLNISSPGWAKHAWSNVFAPWNAEATALNLGYERFNAELLLKAAGEPLNPEVIEKVRDAWRITVRDGYGQTETTAQVGNCPGQPLKLGSMGRPLPGYTVALLDPITGERAEEGELCLDLSRRPLGLMTGYRGDPERDAAAMRGGFYHTGDVASRDSDGYLTYVGRTDDVFKASDYRISPFELESVLIEHEAVAEAAVVPSPDPLRLAVPKAYVTLAAGAAPSSETALAIFAYTRERLAPYKRVRRLEFSDLPKTISGKIRRVELRAQETDRHAGEAPPGPRGVTEFWEEDFPELKS